MHIHCKKGMSFQQTVCYMSFRCVNILHAWTVNSANRLVKNSKHITSFTSPPKPDLYPFAFCQECQNYLKFTSQLPYSTETSVVIR